MTELFRSVPALDKLLKTPQGVELVSQFGHQAVVTSGRQLLIEAREFIKREQHSPDFLQDIDSTLSYLAERLAEQQRVQIQSVHNLTGTILHTNLGRALWPQSAQQAALNAMGHNVALEYDLTEGARSHRDNYVSALLAELTGAEAACIVNNNAAAVLLMLATFAKDREVIISRGELIEIGGAFRIPDIMQQAGCKLIEVGTTNRTHLKDYRQAINENTAFLMKVHCSNYQICGFTASVSEQQLVALGDEFNIPVITDLGSGALIDLSQYGLPTEPTVQEKVAQGVDLVSFSGDKLLGGVQAGIIVGKREWIQQLQAHPLKRVLRCDKVTLAGLEATLRLYLQPEKLTSNIPTLQLLTQPVELLAEQAQQLAERLRQRLNSNYHIEIIDSEAQIGSGSQPMAMLPSKAVAITVPEPLALISRLKQLSQPIVGRIEKGRICLDLRSVANLSELLKTVDEL